MTEATKSKIFSFPIGNMKMIAYDITNLANGETITFPIRKCFLWGGTNRITADKPFAATHSAGVLTAVVSTTTDEYLVWAIGV